MNNSGLPDQASHTAANTQERDTSRRPIRVVFLLFYFEAWDSLAPIYRAMRNNADFTPTVVSMPRKLTGDAEYGNEQLVHEFLEEAGIKHERLSSSNQNENLAQLRALEPDYIFLNYPWQRNYPAPLRPDSLASFAHLAYVPYFLAPLVNEEPGETAGHLYEQRLHQLASLIFVQDADTRKAFEKTSRGAGHVFAVGSPKLEELKRQTTKARNKRRKRTKPRKYEAYVLWAPHHSYSPAWLNFGRFANDYREMLQLAQSRPNVKFTLRPHPFLFGTLVERGVLSQGELNDWLSSFNDLANTAIEHEKPFYKQFAKNDVLITDGISFLAEYPLLMQKPAIFIENPDHWQYNRLGELAAACNLRISSVAEFAEILDVGLESGLAVALGGQDVHSRFERARNALQAELDPARGHVAEAVLAIVQNHYDAGLPLIDPGSIAETPWEDRPGREPRTD